MLFACVCVCVRVCVSPRRHAAEVLQAMHMLVTQGGLMPGFVDQCGLLACYLVSAAPTCPTAWPQPSHARPYGSGLIRLTQRVWPCAYMLDRMAQKAPDTRCTARLASSFLCGVLDRTYCVQCKLLSTMLTCQGASCALANHVPYTHALLLFTGCHHPRLRAQRP